MREARNRDASKLQKKRKQAQMEADNARVVDNRAKEAEKERKKASEAAILKSTGENLALTKEAIVALTKYELNCQLDFHRNAEKNLPMDDSLRIPLKSHMTNNTTRQDCLEKAVLRYTARLEEQVNDDNSPPICKDDPRGASGGMVGMDLEYESDRDDDEV
ncbi:hypothetical protein CVT24_004664 [Panaeolus cyanescens]|uniref:Uncharacterized protein n=1 Tax=Panaeolus cyanescens TaxID=181874 RepID=A0A409YSL6_9AGAR|nr:hypothetical protein CVT24_004664 [Panaeolus cyanescens]